MRARRRHNSEMIEVPKNIRQQAILSIERHFPENMDEPIGDIAASEEEIT
jgi:hypothetical protein